VYSLILHSVRCQCCLTAKPCCHCWDVTSCQAVKTALTRCVRTVAAHALARLLQAIITHAAP
jgi:hypothetical protein